MGIGYLLGGLHVYFTRFSSGILEELRNHLDSLNWLR